MISKIGPLVQAGKRTNLVLHILGGTSGGATIGLLLGAVGIAVERLAGGVTAAMFVIAVPLTLIWAALSEVRFVQLPVLTSSRQTPGFWSCAFGQGPACFAWGFHLGLGLTTRIPHQALIALPVAAVLAADAAFAITLMAAYGFARSLAVTGVIAWSRHGFAHACDVVAEQKATLRLAVSAASISVASSGLANLLSSA